jgi:hypothetical protein
MKRETNKYLGTGLFICMFPIVLFMSTSCLKKDSGQSTNSKYPSDLAIAWIKMQQRVFVETPGLLPHVTSRTYAYMALALYESLVPGMKGYQSISSQLNGKLVLPSALHGIKYCWPASANAAMAQLMRELLPHTSRAMLSSIDSLETVFYKSFMNRMEKQNLPESVGFGKQTANAIFEWSKTDGGHEAYKSIFSENYSAPAGPGKWVPTGEYPFSEPVYPYWGNNRSFIPNLADLTQPSPPPVYSELPGSAFYEAVNEIYKMSLNLSREDSMTAKYWAYQLQDDGDVREYEDVSHAANIATQMILQEKLSLAEAAILYCKHAMAGNEAALSCVKTKYHYNLLRPITYIRTVLGHSDWHPVVHTPPFPEYTSAHAAISMACASVLESTFGKNTPFSDRTFANTYGPRSFDSFREYAEEAALSRLKAGIHYRFSMEQGLKQGRSVAALVEKLRFRK